MNYPKNCWYVASWSEGLVTGAITERVILGESIALLRDENGRPRAVQNRCPHRFAPLHLGTICDGGKRIQCAYHGLQFSLDGACVGNPHGANVPARMSLRSYPTVEKHSLIWIWMGDGVADPSLIPDYSVLDTHGANAKRDYLLMDVSCDLMVDNIMDPSHAGFVHAGVVGNDDTTVGEVKVVQTGRTVVLERICRNIRPPEMFDVAYRGDGAPVDLDSQFIWNPPACIHNQSRISAADGSDPEGAEFVGLHFLAPASDRSVHYYFAAVGKSSRRHEGRDAEAVSQRIAHLRRFAFAEQDGPIIREQQRQMDLAPHARFQLFSVDAAAVRYRRALDAMVAAEQTPVATPS